MELGNLIRKHRTAADMSQDDLAQAIFVSRQTVSNWETGRTCPDVQSLLLMSNLFETSIDELVKGDLEMIESQLSKDAKAMKALGRVVAASLLFAIVAPALGLNLWDWQLAPTAVIFVMGRGIGMATAVGIEVIKRRHNTFGIERTAPADLGLTPRCLERERAKGRGAPRLASPLTT